MNEMTVAINNLFEIIKACLNMITSNVWLSIPFIASLVGVGVSILKALKS